MSKIKCILCTQSSFCTDCKKKMENTLLKDPIKSNKIVTFYESFDYLYIISDSDSYAKKN